MTAATPRIVVGPSRPPRTLRIAALAGICCLVVGLAAGWLLWHSPAQRLALEEVRAELTTAGQREEALQQTLAVAQRAAQVAEFANSELRGQLGDLDREVARLNDEIGFYQRLLESGSGNRGLAVHELTLETTPAAGVFRFRLTLSQNLKKARVVTGAVRFELEGVQGGAARVLSGSAAGVSFGSRPGTFEFKYFQQLEGSIDLPKGFMPQRVLVSLDPEGTDRVITRSFEWAAVTPQASDSTITG